MNKPGKGCRVLTWHKKFNFVNMQIFLIKEDRELGLFFAVQRKIEFHGMRET